MTKATASKTIKMSSRGALRGGNGKAETSRHSDGAAPTRPVNKAHLNGSARTPTYLSTKEKMVAKLAESGLDLKDAKTLGMVALCDEEAVALTGYKTPGFVLPYFDIKGNDTGFWRYRNFSAKVKAKYVQGVATGVAAYFPPFDSAKWTARVKDPAMPLCITEGELKAACATKLGFATLGLGGVWSFKSKAKLQELIPDLDQFEWQGRYTYLIFDSDKNTNSKVMQAQFALAKELFNRGARVYTVDLPALVKKGKTGLDDYLMHPDGGVKGLRRLIKGAEEWSRSAALAEFNNEVIFVRDPGVAVIRETGQRVDVRSLVGALYSNRLYMKPDPTPKDPLRRVESNVAADWMKWPRRAEAQAMTYMPGMNEMTPSGEYNMWKGWGTKPSKGDITPWKTLLDFLLKDCRPSHRRWFEQWCAYPIKYPGAKMYTAVVLWSREHGTGKTLVGYTLGRIYGRNYVEIKDHDLDSSFNSYMTNKQFVLGDEITGNDGGEKRKLANKLKGMITQERVTINQKYVPAYEVPDCVNYMFTSNHCDAFFLEKEDRRYFIVEVKGKPMPIEWYREVYDPWYKSADGIAALHYHLLNLDLSGFDHLAPAPMTESKSTMIEEGRSDLAAWVEELPTMDGARKLMTSEELLLLAQGQGKLNWTKNGITRALRQAGFVRPLGDAQQLVLADRQVRPWLIDRKHPLHKKGSIASQADVRRLWFEERPEGTTPKKFKLKVTKKKK